VVGTLLVGAGLAVLRVGVEPTRPVEVEPTRLVGVVERTRLVGTVERVVPTEPDLVDELPVPRSLEMIPLDRVVVVVVVFPVRLVARVVIPDLVVVGALLPRETVVRDPVPNVVLRVVPALRDVVRSPSRRPRDVLVVVSVFEADPAAPERTTVLLPSSIVTPRAPVAPLKLVPPDRVPRTPPRNRRESPARALRLNVEPLGP